MSPPSINPINILLVDDEQRNLAVLGSILESPEYRLVFAQRGEDALLALLDTEFAAIVMDIRMPGMNGIELANVIKERKRTQNIPIIFLTAHYLDDKDVIHGYEVGAVDFLTKPVNPKILKSKIAVFVDLHRKTCALSASNIALQLEVAERLKAEEALRQVNSELESRVRGRTIELSLANRELRASEQRYLQLIRSLPAAVYTTDPHGRITLFNDAAAKLWGREPEIGKDLWCGSIRILSPDGTPIALSECPMAETLKTGRSIRGTEIIVERPDGTRRHVLAYPEPIFGSAGDILGAVNMLLDFTDLKLAERAARESESRLRMATQTGKVGLWDWDLVADQFSWTDSLYAIHGVTPATFDGSAKGFKALVHEEDVSLIENAIQRALEDVAPYEIEFRARKPDRQVIWLYANATVLREQGRAVRMVGATLDVTARKQAELALRDSEARLSAASRAKDEFLATLSHELRTPLNPVLLQASDGAENMEFSRAARAAFASIRQNVELEARLIDDLLDLTRIARGKLSLDLRAQDVHFLLNEAAKSVQAELDRKGIQLVTEFSTERPFVLGDDVRLQQVFWNMLTNSAKFTPAGGRVTVQTARSTGGKSLEIRIQDTGIGMTSEEIGRVFDAFSQGDHATGSDTHRFGGVGLGLAIARRLVELQKGTIRATSPGRNMGSTFVIDLPLAPVPRDGESSDFLSMEKWPSTRDALAPAVGRILVVEDHLTTRETLAHLLRRRGHDVSTAATVAEALECARNGNFDVLISDIGLPDGNGYDLMHRLRQTSSIKGIALTGYGMDDDIARSQAAGFFTHLTKPIRVQSLESALALAAALAAHVPTAGSTVLKRA